MLKKAPLMFTLIILFLITLSSIVLGDIVVKQPRVDFSVDKDIMTINNINIKLDKDLTLQSYENVKTKENTNEIIMKEIKIVETFSNPDNKDNLSYDWGKNPPSRIDKIEYAQDVSRAINCGVDEKCWQDRRNKYYYYLCWEDENFCIDTYSENDIKLYNKGKAGNVFDVVLYDTGYYKKIDDEFLDKYMSIRIEADMIISTGNIKLNETINKSEFINTLMTPAGQICTPLNLSKQMNITNIPIWCTITAENNTILQFNRTMLSSAKVRGFQLSFLVDSMPSSLSSTGYFIIKNNVTGEFDGVTFMLDGHRGGFGITMFTTTGTVDKGYLKFDNSILKNHGYPTSLDNPLVYEIQFNKFYNASFENCFFSYATPTIISNVNNIKLLGSSNVIESSLGFPSDINSTGGNFIAIKAITEPASACFISPTFGNGYGEFSNANLECNVFSSGIFSGNYMNLTDSVLKINNAGFQTSGYASSATVTMYNTQSYQFVNAFTGESIVVKTDCYNYNTSKVPSRPNLFKTMSYSNTGYNMTKAFMHSAKDMAYNLNTVDVTYQTICNFTSPTNEFIPYLNQIMDTCEPHSGRMRMVPYTYEIRLKSDSEFSLVLS